MTDDDKPQFVMHVTAMAAAYDKAADEALFDGYWITLEDLPLDKVIDAIKEAMRECDHLPKAAELRKRARAVVEAELDSERQRVERHRNYVQGMSHQILRCGRRAEASEETIRAELKRIGAEYGCELYWPGEEPWNKTDQRRFKASEPLMLNFEEGNR